YTVNSPDHQWETWVVPTLRGEPRPWLRNASGLTWIAPDRVLYSERREQDHMGIVAAAVSGPTASRDVYFPADIVGMAHRSYRSPDGRSAIVVEMGGGGQWLPCRLVPFDGSSAGRPVGPMKAACTGAAWSPDGSWMYFSANNGNGFHVWRQRFPNAELQ